MKITKCDICGVGANYDVAPDSTLEFQLFGKKYGDICNICQLWLEDAIKERVKITMCL